MTEIDRDRFGRPLVIPPGGGKPVPYTRCTTFVGATEDTWNLSRWQQRNVALGLAERPDLILAVSNSRDDKKALNKICEDAAEAAKAHAKATIGTALHGLTERMDRGDDVGVVPAEYLADLAAYQAATARLEMVEIEKFMVLDAWKIAGTPDRIVRVDGKLRIFDLKTGSIELGIGKIASQLAVYSRAMHYNPDTGERTYSGVETDWGIIAHLPAGEGRCELHRVDLMKGWRGVQLSKHVRDWRARKFVDFVTAYDGATRDPGDDATRESVADRIQAAATVEQLNAIYDANPSGWTDEYTQLAKARKAELQTSAA
jgi:PD-(D/E)XK nuclease superfamily protein